MSPVFSIRPFVVSVLLCSVLAGCREESSDKPMSRRSDALMTHGVAGDLASDVVLGQPDHFQGMPGEVVPFKVSGPGGVVVDRHVQPNRVYVYDGRNSRVLGFDALGTCFASPNLCTDRNDCNGDACVYDTGGPTGRAPSVVLGQDSFHASACNGDGTYQNEPDVAAPSARSLCSIHPGAGSPLEDGSFAALAVDADGNVWVPDFHNNRVVRYPDPFAAGKTAGFDAEIVLGQADFTHRDCNRGRGSPDSTTLCLEVYNHGPVNNPLTAGVDVDPSGNVWVADAGNHRVLRFPKIGGTISKTADRVIGQTDFAHASRGDGDQQLEYPVAVRVSATGQVYVADSENNRIMVFRWDAATSTYIGRRFNAEGFPIRNPTGLEFDIEDPTDPDSGGLWVADSNHSQEVLFGFDGIPKKVLMKRGFNDPDACVTMCEVRGSLGITSAGDVIAASSTSFQDARVYTAPIPAISTAQIEAIEPGSSCAFGGLRVTVRRGATTLDSRTVCHADAGPSPAGTAYAHESPAAYGVECPIGGKMIETGVGSIPGDVLWACFEQPTHQFAAASLFPPENENNFMSERGLLSPRGIAFTEGGQLVVTDPYRVLFWNAPDGIRSLTNGQAADGALKQTHFRNATFEHYGRLDSAGTDLWIIRSTSMLEHYTLPLTHGQQPDATIDLQSRVELLGDGPLSVGLVAYDVHAEPDGRHLWIATMNQDVVVRLRIPANITTGAFVVDAVIGEYPIPAQRYGWHRECPPEPTNGSGPYPLCSPGAVTLDGRGHVYVSEYYVENEGPGRFHRFDASLFPKNQSSIITLDRLGATQTFPDVPSWKPAFGADHGMVVGGALFTHRGNRAYVYPDVTTLSQLGSSPRLADHFTQAFASEFDRFGNLYVTDMNRGRILIYKRPWKGAGEGYLDEPEETSDAGITGEQDAGSPPSDAGLPDTDAGDGTIVDAGGHESFDAGADSGAGGVNEPGAKIDDGCLCSSGSLGWTALLGAFLRGNLIRRRRRSRAES